MGRMAVRLLAIVLVSAAAHGADPALFERFQKVKTHFEGKSYELALVEIDSIEKDLRESRSPEAPKIEPALLFYRGASYAMLGATGDAIATFREFLKVEPSVVLDPSVYGKPVREALERAQRLVRRAAGSPSGGRRSGIVASYADFRYTRVHENGPNGDFARGPLWRIATSREREEWKALVSDAEKGAFLVRFWERRNPDPGARVNSLRQELDKRIAFADAAFTQGETRGAMTDRGEVFVLLGTPAYIGRKPLSRSDDPSVGQQAADLGTPPLGGSLQQIQIYNMTADTNPTVNFRASDDYRETWHYYVLPRGVPGHELDLDFVTRKGIGEEQLSRTAPVVQVLQAAARLLGPTN